MLPVDVTIGTLRPEDREQDARLRGQAFTVDPGPFDPNKPSIPLDRVHVASRNGTILGTVSVFPFGQWFGGRSVPMGGVAGVAVKPEARGQGLAKRLMTEAILAMRDRGEVISALYPTTSELYRSVGYEFAGRHEEITIDLRAIATAARPAPNDRLLNVEPLQAGDLDPVRVLYDEVARTSHGWLDRGDIFWQRLAYEANPERHNAFSYLISDNDGTANAGFTVTHRRGDAALKFGVDVNGPFARTPAGMRAALRLLVSLGTTADTATFTLPIELLSLTLPSAAVEARRSTLWMLRIIDLPGALVARGFGRRTTDTLRFRVVDPIARWNEGPWALSVTDGEANVERLDRTDGVALSLDIQTLSALYTGFFNPNDLARVGRLPGADPDDVETLAQIFAGPAPRLADFF